MPSPSEIADRLVAARHGGPPVPWREALPADEAGAYAIQDATVRRLGAIGGWKVGATGPDAAPLAAPCPVTGVMSSHVTLAGPQWRLRCVEVEVALRLGRDLDGSTQERGALLAAVDAVLPLIEIVETRLEGWSESEPLAKLADLQSHGALVLGAPASVDPGAVRLEEVEAELRFDGHVVAATRGGNPAGDVARLLGFVAAHAARRGMPLRAGQIVTTGSCTGMLFAEAGTRVEAKLAGLGEIALQF